MATDTPIIGNWSLGAPLMAASGPGESTAAPGIEACDADGVAEAVISLWASVLSDRALPELPIFVGDLPNGLLGIASGNSITLDANANGAGWFVDDTPWDHSEFMSRPGRRSLVAAPGSPAEERYDLLTAIAHEYGHLLGYEHIEDDVMGEELDPGTRRLPDAYHADDDLLEALAGDISAIWRN
jgi:hypothetical protein